MLCVPSQYNCPRQPWMSGGIKCIGMAAEPMKAAGAKRALVIPGGGAFHSPLMEPAREELAAAIEHTAFRRGVCPVYQNVVARGVTDPDQIRQNLINQLTAPVRWHQPIEDMIKDR